jgi:hypothetical protein
LPASCRRSEKDVSARASDIIVAARTTPSLTVLIPRLQLSQQISQPAKITLLPWRLGTTAHQCIEDAFGVKHV